MKSSGKRSGLRFHLLVESSGFHSIKPRQILVEHHSLPPQGVYCIEDFAGKIA